jgi:hypothetical protein
MNPWFDQSGRDMRSVEEWEREETAGPTFKGLFLRAFVVAAVIGLLIGIVWTIAGLWHFHGSRLF